MERIPPDDAEAEEVFDHELTRVLQEHGHALEEQSRTLLAAGVVSITSPGVMLRAKLRLPPWRRRGWLEIAREDSLSSEVTGSCSVPVGNAGRNRESLIEEITICLAMELAHGC